MPSRPFDLIRTPSGKVVRDILKAVDYNYMALSKEDISGIRQAMRLTGFPDIRSILLPPAIIHKSLQQPLLHDLLVTRIGYVRRAAGHYIPRPDGSLDHIIHYCAEGKGWLQIRSTRWVVPTGTVLLIPRGVPHAYGADEKDPWSVYWIHLTGARATNYFDFLNITPNAPLIHLEDAADILAAFERTYSLMKAVHTEENLIAASMACVGLLYGLAKGARSIESQSRKVKDRLNGVVEFMKQNMTNPIRLEELAQLAHMSIDRFGKVFRHHFGCTPMDYFARMRMQQACQLLTKGTDQIQEIARKVGYEDQYYFSRAFTKYIGMSPRQFRHPSDKGTSAVSPARP